MRPESAMPTNARKKPPPKGGQQRPRMDKAAILALLESWDQGGKAEDRRQEEDLRRLIAALEEDRFSARRLFS